MVEAGETASVQCGQYSEAMVTAVGQTLKHQEKGCLRAQDRGGDEQSSWEENISTIYRKP